MRSTHHTIEDQVCPRANVEHSDRFIRIRYENGRAPGTLVGPPCGVRSLSHRFGVALGDAVVLRVGFKHFRPTVSKVEGGALLPLMCETVHIDELGDILTIVCEETERSTCVHRLELGVVTDEQNLCSGIRGNPCNALE